MYLTKTTGQTATRYYLRNRRISPDTFDIIFREAKCNGTLQSALAIATGGVERERWEIVGNAKKLAEITKKAEVEIGAKKGKRVIKETRKQKAGKKKSG